MRLKGKRAVFRQILAGDPLEAQICHFEPANHHFEGKMKHFEAKRMHFQARMMHFEAKIAHFEAKIVHFAVESGQFEAFWQFWRPKFPKRQPYFFDEFLIRLKGKRAVFRQILAGDPLEAQICHFEPANHHFEGKMKHFEAKRMHFQARMTHFEAKIAHFEAKIVHFAVESGHFEAFWQFWRPKFPKRQPYFFDEFFIRLKGKRAVFRQILAGDPFEAQICHFGRANHNFEAKMVHFEAKMTHFEAEMKHFEAKMKHFDPKPLKNPGLRP